MRRKPSFPYHIPIPAKIPGCASGVDNWCWGLQRANTMS